MSDKVEATFHGASRAETLAAVLAEHERTRRQTRYVDLMWEHWLGCVCGHEVVISRAGERVPRNPMWFEAHVAAALDAALTAWEGDQ